MRAVPTMLSVVVAGCVAASCGDGQPSADPAREPATDASTAAPTLDEAATARYTGLPLGEVALREGAWERPAGDGASARVVLVESFRVTGDLDGTPGDEAVVLLATSSGGSGTFDHVAVLDRRADGTVVAATAALGDRVQVRGAVVRDRQLIVDVVRAGPKDPMCCPGEKARLVFSMTGQGLERRGDEAIGRISLEDLGGTFWILARLDRDDPAPAEPPITLQYRQGSLSGHGGCNRYTAAVTPGDQDGAIAVSRIVATRMSCPGAVDVVERRFLPQLESVQKYSFSGGRLVLTYRKADGVGSMVFDRIP